MKLKQEFLIADFDFTAPLCRMVQTDLGSSICKV